MTSDRHPLALIIHGPGGAGKDAVVDALRDRLGLVRPTSSTSRPPRTGDSAEEHGREYYFYDPATFEQMIAAGAFIEHAPVQGAHKGIERDKFEPLLKSGVDLVIRTDVQGAKRWKEMLDGAVSILLLPESLGHLKEQARGRGDSPDEIAVRVAEYPRDIEVGAHNDYTIVNLFGQLENTIQIVCAIAEYERTNPKRSPLRLHEG